MSNNNLSKFNAIIYKKLNDRKINYILNTAADKVMEDIKSLAPVDTGTYRNSIQKSDVIKHGKVYSIEIFTNLKIGGDNPKWKDVPLGYLLEWGTGIVGQNSNQYPHNYPYRQDSWTYFNERYNKWITTYGNIARPHFYPGLHLNKNYFIDLIRKEITK